MTLSTNGCRCATVSMSFLLTVSNQLYLRMRPSEAAGEHPAHVWRRGHGVDRRARGAAMVGRMSYVSATRASGPHGGAQWERQPRGVGRRARRRRGLGRREEVAGLVVRSSEAPRMTPFVPCGRARAGGSASATPGGRRRLRRLRRPRRRPHRHVLVLLVLLILAAPSSASSMSTSPSPSSPSSRSSIWSSPSSELLLEANCDQA